MKKVMFFAMGLCVSLMLWSCKGQSTGGNSDSEDSLTALNNPLRVGLPAVEKFVRVTAEESTEVFMEADVESPWRVTWVEDIESDMAEIVDKWSNEDVPDGYRCDEYPAYAGTVLAVLGEEGDFYKVSIHNWRCDMEYGFVKKADVEEVQPEKVTEETLKELLDEMEWVHIKVVEEGKYKGLVLRSIQDELEGETFDVGVMLNGMLAFPEANETYIEYNPDVEELIFVDDAPDGRFPLYFRYPKSMADWSEEYDFSRGFDPNKLTDEQIDRIVREMQDKKSEYVKYDYLIPMTEGGMQTFWLKSK